MGTLQTSSSDMRIPLTGVHCSVMPGQVRIDLSGRHGLGVYPTTPPCHQTLALRGPVGDATLAPLARREQ